MIPASMMARLLLGLLLCSSLAQARAPLVLLTDFGKSLLYVNSLLNLAVALNQRSYAAVHKIDWGPDWFNEIGKD